MVKSNFSNYWYLGVPITPVDQQVLKKKERKYQYVLRVEGVSTISRNFNYVCECTDCDVKLISNSGLRSKKFGSHRAKEQTGVRKA